MRLVLAIVIGLASATRLHAQNATVDAVVRGKSCGVSDLRASPSSPGDRYCRFDVAGSLVFTISWPDSGAPRISVSRATDADAAYHFAYDSASGCVVVNPGIATMRAELLAGRRELSAYVSVRTGAVYGTEAACRADRRAA